ncbi:MAG: efflux RND transporter periplasmic adaptor subunit [Candidatus Eremiobacteraeota bacterium]|nr:efflux RND transporter periplasmic adaptor subunit [Candidatus Eremiobacteraeota bacterium]MBC5804557.1 efflux RND transporter periplasmic adaptor subunit [Candidatus Eremiobacteraeota bacterium]MBC5822883.1 efflux RND transporter periplasmic adaptor subunit [Candidatus Eremiobacteraeota bacterium]
MRCIAFVALVGTVIINGCSRPAPAPAPTPSPKGPPISTGIVRRGSEPITVSGFGTVSGGANAQASLAFPQAGRIASVDVTIGQQVAAGSVLARLDPGPFEADLAQAQAGLTAAQANYAKVAAGSRPQQLAQTEAQISGARTQLAVANVKLARQRQLLRLGIAAQADIDSAQAEVASAAAALHVLEQQQSAQRTPWAPDLAAARAAVAQAAAQVSASRQKLQSATLRAPFDGVVTARLHQDGESVDATSPVISLSHSGGAVFTAQFAPSDAQRVHAGDTASVSVSGVPPTRGRVVAINPAQSADARTVPVLVNLEPAGVALGPGAYGKASIQVGSRRGLYVPSGAVVSDPTTGITQVLRKSRDGFEPVKITIASEHAGRSWISAGDLHAGDMIVVRGAYALLAPPANANGDGDAK